MIFQVIPINRRFLYPSPKNKIAKKLSTRSLTVRFVSTALFLSVFSSSSLSFSPAGLDSEPWTELQHIKSLHQNGHGKHLGQSQQQMEDYLACVSRIYNARSAIPYGLHQTQLVLRFHDLYCSICSIVRNSSDSYRRS